MAQVHDLQDAFNFIEGIIDDLRVEVDEKSAEVEGLRGELDSRDSEIEDLKNQLAAWEDA